jgi:hypothetical protein
MEVPVLRINRTIAGSFVIMFFVGCAGNYSIREQNILSDVPSEYRNYNGGIIVDPNDNEVKSAISLGVSSKDSDVLLYSYLIKLPRELFDDDTIYFKVVTPLFLISDHAREQARDFRQIDQKYVERARKLNAVKLSLTQQYTSNVTLRQFVFQRQIILLRNGIRVEPLKEITPINGQNPFNDKLGKNAQATIAKTTQMATQYSRGFATTMNKEQKAQLIRTYKSMGLTEEQMVAYTGFSSDEIKSFSVGASEAQEGKIALTEFDAIYSVEGLNTPGNYEVVFRTPPTTSLFNPGDKEVRLPVTFDKFK